MVGQKQPVYVLGVGMTKVNSVNSSNSTLDSHIPSSSSPAAKSTTRS